MNYGGICPADGSAGVGGKNNGKRFDYPCGVFSSQGEEQNRLHVERWLTWERDTHYWVSSVSGVSSELL